MWTVSTRATRQIQPPGDHAFPNVAGLLVCQATRFAMPTHWVALVLWNPTQGPYSVSASVFHSPMNVLWRMDIQNRPLIIAEKPACWGLFTWLQARLTRVCRCSIIHMYCPDVHDELIKFGAGSKGGRGGMLSKVKAAWMAGSQGCNCIIANGKNPDALLRVSRLSFRSLSNIPHQ